MLAFKGVFSGIGHNPQLTRICSRIAVARDAHSDRERIAGNSRGVFKSLILRAR